MRQNKSESVGCLWVIWFITCLAVPFLPLSKMESGQSAVATAAWMAFGIVAAVSVFFAACRAKARPWSPEWWREMLPMAIGLSILGAAISTAVGCAGCVYTVMGRL